MHQLQQVMQHQYIKIIYQPIFLILNYLHIQCITKYRSFFKCFTIKSSQIRIFKTSKIYLCKLFLFIKFIIHMLVQ